MGTILTRLFGRFRRPAAETRLNDEVRVHLDYLEAEYVRGGMPPEEARFAARRAFGGVEQMKERDRDRRGLPWLDDLARDLHYAARSLRRSPGFAIACTSILTLGIGLNLALFQLVNVTTLQPLPVKDPDTLARFYRLDGVGSSSLVPYAATRFIQEHQRVLSAVLTHRSSMFRGQATPPTRSAPHTCRRTGFASWVTRRPAEGASSTPSTSGPVRRRSSSPHCIPHCVPCA